jgi:plastocyanin
MGKPGRIAFPVILALGAVTGYITYTYFTNAIPAENRIDSPYYHPLSPASGGGNATNSTGGGGGQVIDESKYSNVITVKILQGASVQGNPNFEPNTATASSDALIKWINEDAVPHTATSGTGQSDPESGKLFDSKILEKDKGFSVPAADLGSGEHSYYCTIHPYMAGKVTVQ